MGTFISTKKTDYGSIFIVKVTAKSATFDDIDAKDTSAGCFMTLKLTPAVPYLFLAENYKQTIPGAACYGEEDVTVTPAADGSLILQRSYGGGAVLTKRK